MTLAPVVLFVYNRPGHTLQTLDALSKNDLAPDSVLFIFADGPKENASPQELESINETRLAIRKKKWCKEVYITEANVNKGLADSIIEGVTKIIDEYGKIIVLEDDLVTAKGFLKYMNDALTLYENEDKVMHISGYMFPVKAKLPVTFFYRQTSCWGWGTWSNRWKKLEKSAVVLEKKLVKTEKIKAADIDGTNQFLNQLKANIDGRIKTWAVLWHFSVFILDGLCLHPGKSLVQNIGLDNSGTNCNETNQFNVELANYVLVKKNPLKEYSKIYQHLQKFYLPKSEEFDLVKKLKNLLRTVMPAVAWQGLKIVSDKQYRINQKEIKRIDDLPRFVETETIFLSRKLRIVDNRSYLFIRKEIFDNEIYKFTSKTITPYILDCGSNIGLSIIYFKQLYPQAEIVGFEPDKTVFDVLKFNVQSFKLSNVTLIEKACWNEETTLKFYSEGADGGRKATKNDTEDVIEVKAIRLREYLKRPVDFLKIDIEGAEVEVLQDCCDLLYNVDKLFVEYHSFVNQDQKLSRVLEILSEGGFRYQIHHVGIFSSNPFVNVAISNNVDLQLNIFAYKK